MAQRKRTPLKDLQRVPPAPDPVRSALEEIQRLATDERRLQVIQDDRVAMSNHQILQRIADKLDWPQK